MGNKKQLEEALTLLKNLKDETTALKELGKTQSEKTEQIVKDLMAKREVAIREDVISRFRKGEHLTPGDDDSDQVNMQNVLLRKSDNPKVREMMEFNDNVYLVSKMLRVHPHQTRLWKENQAQVNELRKTMNITTTTQGGNWVPTEFSADLIELMRLELKVGALFPKITMPTNPYVLPIETSDATVYHVAEPSTDATEAGRITASTPGSGKITMSAEKVAGRTVYTEEVNEDSIIPVVPFLKGNLARKMADAWETILINGDTRTVGNIDIDVTSATDKKTTQSGIRRRAIDNSFTVALTTFNLTNLRSMRTSMGKWGVNPRDLVWITGPIGWFQMQGLDEVTTLEKYGAAATILTGELGRLDGIPIIVSEHVREDLSTTGRYDATTTDNTMIALVNIRRWMQGERRKITLKTFEDIQNDQTVLVTTMRQAFNSLETSDNQNGRNVVVGRDVSNT